MYHVSAQGVDECMINIHFLLTKVREQNISKI